jgi:hypothetical protein
LLLLLLLVVMIFFFFFETGFQLCNPGSPRTL